MLSKKYGGQWQLQLKEEIRYVVNKVHDISRRQYRQIELIYRYNKCLQKLSKSIIDDDPALQFGVSGILSQKVKQLFANLQIFCILGVKQYRQYILDLE